MRTLTYQLRDLKKVTIEIGFEGENNRTQVRIDCGEVFAEYPNAAVSMKVQAPKGGIYPATVNRDGNMILWTVRDCDVANKGNGEIQLTFTDGETVVKSCRGKIHIDRSLKGSGTAPSGVQDWLERAEEVLEGVEAAEIHQPMIGLDGYWYKWDQEAQQYVSTNVKAQGQDGKGIVSIAKTGTSGNVDTYTITFTDGTTTTYTVTNSGTVIDDTTPASDKVFSSEKVNTELNTVKSALQEMDGDLDDAVYFEETQDDDSIEGIIESEIKDKMTFGLSGNILSIKYDGDTVCTVELPTSQPIQCTGVELNISATSVEEEKTVSLTATLTPSNTTDAVSWSTSDDEVATVNNGVVTGVAKGTATITVTCGSFSDTCSVTVIAYFREPILGYIMSQSNRIDYRSSYNYLSGGTFNDPFLKKVTTGQKVSLKYTPDIISSLYVYMYVYKPGAFTDKCSKVGDDYVLTQAMIDMQSSNTYGILISSERLYSYGQYASVWEGDYTATEDCYVAFFFNRNGVSDISTDLAAIKQAIRIEVE